MVDLHLNKAHKFFYFQTRIHSRQSIDWHQLWDYALISIAELRKECGIEVYGFSIDSGQLQLVFSTPHFNENILILDWELGMKKWLSIRFSRPVSCEPIYDDAEVKRILLEIYSSQLIVQKNAIGWKSPYNSLKLLLEGSVHARLFNDPLKIVFQPSLVLQFQKRSQNGVTVENRSIDVVR